jgi:hypothetical protein
VVCELGTIEIFRLSGGLRDRASEKDVLLGAVIDGEEGEAGWVPGGNRRLCFDQPPRATSKFESSGFPDWNVSISVTVQSVH